MVTEPNGTESVHTASWQSVWTPRKHSVLAFTSANSRSRGRMLDINSTVGRCHCPLMESVPLEGLAQPALREMDKLTKALCRWQAAVQGLDAQVRPV